MSELLDVLVPLERWGHYKKLKKLQGMAAESRLHNPQSGLNCCLGFAGNAIGLSDEVMARETMPHSSKAISSVFLERLPKLLDDICGVIVPSIVCNQLARENDGGGMSLQGRMEIIRDLGIQAGINFIFTKGGEPIDINMYEGEE